jgi:type IV fimbrial biogenesis protein FimT
MQTRSTLQGFTLFELIVTIGLATLVLTLGLPSFGGIIANHRLRVEVNALFHAVHLARKESIVRRRVVTLCPTRDGLACERDPDWSSGWMMFVNRDRNGDSQRDPDEPILQHFAVDPATRIVANRMSFSLRSTELRATNGTFIFCDRAQRAAPRALIISYTGRPRVSRTDRRGRAYECPD